MSDPRLCKLAQVIVRYCVKVRPGDRVGIMPVGSIASSLPLQAEVIREVLRSGGQPHPYVLPARTDEFDYVFFSTAAEAQLQRPDRVIEFFTKELDCDINILCETNTRRLSHIDSERQAMWGRAQSDSVHLYYERAAKGELRWVYTACPTPAYAQDAEMSLEEYEDFVYSSMLVDGEDPISLWEDIGRKQKVLVDWLGAKKTVQVKGKHVDLSFSIAGRTFISCDGHLNMPDGEIFTGPVEDSVNGWLESTYPAIKFGIDVGKVTFRFENGTIVRADAEKNQAHLDKLLATDEGSHRLGEFGIGTNSAIKVFTKNMLFDEKIGGTIHVAAGLGFPESGARNESALHWDFLCDMSEGGKITVDGQPFYDSGRFLL
ncbi:MAG: aminopeptidase [Chloroflexi bacterium]|nr:aminopeptidase [Chloroflexota bacterium]